jgi:hypothetical protein
MKRFIFSVAENETRLISADEQKTRIANYSSLDPSFTYFSRISWTLDVDDLADIHLIERNNYKDPDSALAKKFMSCAIATAAGLAEVFARPGLTIIYVCIEILDESYNVTVLQDRHPRAISGSRELAPVPPIRADLGKIAIKNAIARVAGRLKTQLAQNKTQAVATPPTSSGPDI